MHTVWDILGNFLGWLFVVIVHGGDGGVLALLALGGLLYGLFWLLPLKLLRTLCWCVWDLPRAGVVALCLRALGPIRLRPMVLSRGEAPESSGDL